MKLTRQQIDLLEKQNANHWEYYNQWLGFCKNACERGDYISLSNGLKQAEYHLTMCARTKVIKGRTALR